MSGIGLGEGISYNPGSSSGGGIDPSKVVTIAGEQTVTGKKHFNGGATAPEPVADDDVATKKYVDDNSGGSTSGLVPETRTINGHALDSDVTLDASDVGALPDSTVIPDTSTFVQNDQWASDVKGGIMKQRLDTGTSTLFLSFDGTDL